MTDTILHLQSYFPSALYTTEPGSSSTMSDASERSEAHPPDTPIPDEGQSAQSTFTLQIVSPSVGVSAPLSFPGLPITTNLKELKAKIRDILPSRPADEDQRLIHRGRMLGNATETMVNIFGEAAVGTSYIGMHIVTKPMAA